jgi:hypothetical protein
LLDSPLCTHLMQGDKADALSAGWFVAPLKLLTEPFRVEQRQRGHSNVSVAELVEVSAWVVRRWFRNFYNRISAIPIEMHATHLLEYMGERSWPPWLTLLSHYP